MEPPLEPLAGAEAQADLRAALAARQELGREMEEPILEAFLARIEHRIDERVDVTLEQRSRQMAAGSDRQGKSSKQGSPEAIIGTSLGVAIPLVVLAGIFGGTPGVIAVMACVLAINALYVLRDIV